MTLYNITAASIAIFFALLILLLVRKQRLSTLHTLWWMLAVCGMLALGFFPAAVDWVGHKLGISYPPILPILLALCLLFVKVLTMDIEDTRRGVNLKILAQKMAAYEAELHSLKEKLRSMPQDRCNTD